MNFKYIFTKKVLIISILLIILGLIYNQTFIISVHPDVINEQDKEKQALDICRSLNEIVVLIHDKNLKVEDVKKWIRNYEILVTKYNNTNFMSYPQVKYNISRRITGLSKNKLGFEEFKEYVKQTPNSNILDALQYGIGCYYFSQGNLNQALEIFKSVILHFPNSYYASFLPNQEILALEKEAEELKLINERYREQNDERLWILGYLYWQSMQKSWNVVEVGYDMSLPFKIFNELIEKYPKSQWADNADFKMINYNRINSQEGGDMSGSLYYVNEYNNFLKKYPNSELIPDAELSIASLYFYSGKGFDKRNYNEEDYEMVDLAKKKTQEVISKYPKSDVLNDAHNLLNEIINFEKEYLKQ